MRIPRVDYFDPKAIPSLKSSMDNLPVIESPRHNPSAQLAKSSLVPKQVQLKKGANEGTNDASNERSTERTKIRHTFDILADQLLGLREIAIAREKIFGKRVLLGELVQEALDRFITKERNKE